MTTKTKNFIALVLFTCGLLIGLLSIYRATLPISQLTTITGKVVSKKIQYYVNLRTGKHYSVTFKLDHYPGKLGINLGTKREANNDSAFYLIDTGKIYKFYLDPTIPTLDGKNMGINKIDYNNNQVYRTSNKLNLYGGIFLSIFSLALIIFLFKYKKKEIGKSSPSI